MKKINIFLFTGLSILWTGCNSVVKQNLSLTNRPDTVLVFSLDKETGIKNLTLPAELIPWERAELFARIQGYIKTISVDIGDQVSEGQVLAIIDAPEVQADYAKSLAEMQSALVKYNSTKDNYLRLKTASNTKGIVSEIDLDNALDRMRSDSAVYESAKYAAYSFAQMKNYLSIKAPFSGTITRREADPGAMVGTGGKPILVVENTGKLRLRMAVPEMYAALMPDTDEIGFTVNAEPDLNFHAQFSRRSKNVDNTTRTELWDFIYNNEAGELKAGMFAKADLKLRRDKPVFTIPSSALVTNQERNFVIRVNNHKAEWVDVRNGITFSDKLEIFGPLASGDQLILKPSDEIREGQDLVIKQ